MVKKTTVVNKSMLEKFVPCELPAEECVSISNRKWVKVMLVHLKNTDEWRVMVTGEKDLVCKVDFGRKDFYQAQVVFSVINDIPSVAFLKESHGMEIISEGV